MALSPYYATGSVSLAQGSGPTVVTGIGTAWLSNLPDSFTYEFQIPGYPWMPVQSVDADTQITLMDGWSGPSQTSVAYRIRYIAANSGLASKTTSLLNLLGNGALQAIAGLSAATGDFLSFIGGSWMNRSVSQVLTALGLTNTPYITIPVVLSGGGSALSAGLVVYMPPAESDYTLTKYTALGDQSGSVSVDVWKCTYAQFDGGITHPVMADSITAANPIAIAASSKNQDSTLSGWNVSVKKDDILAFRVNSATSIKQLTIGLSATRAA